MADCPQINNTTIIGTSAVSYDSTPLPCTGVNTCDDLNTILTKFDNVICSAVNSVNILSEDIMNITEDIMIITEDIENINNQIFICCPICDFTITATELPVCEFTVTANELVDTCSFTGDADQLPDPTTTTTSSSTSTSSTTTTTTTICPCTYMNITITPGYIAFSDTGSVNVTYTNCQGLPDSITYTVSGTYIICSSNINSIEGHYTRFGVPLIVPVFPFNLGTLCCIPTTTSTSTSTSTSSTSTTTTTTTSQLLLCYQAEVYPPIFNPETFHTVQYLDCYGNVQVVNVPDGGEMVTICYTGIVSDNNNGITNFLFTYCLEPTTTTTTTI